MAAKTISASVGSAARSGAREWAAKLAAAAALVVLLSGVFLTGTAYALYPAYDHAASSRATAASANAQPFVDPVRPAMAERASAAEARMANKELQMARGLPSASTSPALSLTAADLRQELKDMREARSGYTPAAAVASANPTSKERYLDMKSRQLEQ